MRKTENMVIHAVYQLLDTPYEIGCYGAVALVFALLLSVGALAQEMSP